MKKSINWYSEMIIEADERWCDLTDVFVISKVYRVKYVCFLEDVCYETNAFLLKYPVLYMGDLSKKYVDNICFCLGVQKCHTMSNMYSFPSLFYDFSFDVFCFARKQFEFQTVYLPNSSLIYCSRILNVLRNISA